MPINILMPALSPTMEKGNLSRWLKKEGDKIKSGDILAEIETDKATMEVEAVDEGVLAKIIVPDGTADVAVNAVIGVIARGGRRRNERARLGRGSLPPRPLPSPRPRPLRPLPRAAMAPPSTAMPGHACSPRRWRAASPRPKASTSPRSQAQARMAASSSATSRRR